MDFEPARILGRKLEPSRDGLALVLTYAYHAKIKAISEMKSEKPIGEKHEEKKIKTKVFHQIRVIR